MKLCNQITFLPSDCNSNSKTPEKTHVWLSRNDHSTRGISSSWISFFGVVVKYFDGWATVILPVDETVQPNHVFALGLQQNSWENARLTITQWPQHQRHQLKLNKLLWGSCEVFWWVSHGHTACCGRAGWISKILPNLWGKRTANKWPQKCDGGPYNGADSVPWPFIYIYIKELPIYKKESGCIPPVDG